MITNLVFKRTVNVEGSNKTEMKIIELNIPEIKSSEGWTLVSSADNVIVASRIEAEKCVDIPPEIKAEQAEEDAAIAEFLEKYRVEKEEKREQLMRQLACSCSGKPDPSITVHSGCAGEVELYTKPEVDAKLAEVATNPENIKENTTDSIDVTMNTPKKPTEYPSPINGTACLFRRNDIIRIAYREGKKANINTPNKVCISDRDKQHFFNAVRADNVNADIFISWSLNKNSRYYDEWNRFIDDEYIAQREEYLRRAKGKK